MGTLLKPAQVRLDGISSFYRINCTTQEPLAGGSLDPTVYIIDKDVEKHQSPDYP